MRGRGLEVAVVRPAVEEEAGLGGPPGRQGAEIEEVEFAGEGGGEEGEGGGDGVGEEFGGGGGEGDVWGVEEGVEGGEG